MTTKTINARPTLGDARLAEIRRQVEERRALREDTVSVAPYTDSDMKVKPFNIEDYRKGK